MSDLTAVRWHQNGFTDLVSVIPPNASLSPRSTIAKTALGKSPGLRYTNGTWGGYNWLHTDADVDQVREWALAGANIGLKAARFPAVDLDVLNPQLAGLLVAETTRVLGWAPVRIGRAPKSLLMYRLKDGADPFGRMALTIRDEGANHLVEILGAGRQYLIHGTHPSGSAYQWGVDPAGLTADALTPIDRDDAVKLLAHLKHTLETVGYEVTVLGEERRAAKGGTVAETLLAPSLEALEAAVRAIPNECPTREEYIKFGYAVKAAGAGLDQDVEYIFAEWADRWTGGVNDPSVVRGDWIRMQPPYSVGWPWLAAQARQHGFNDAEYDFAAEEPAGERALEAPLWSDQWLAAAAIRDHGDHVRYLPLERRWRVWDGQRWAEDATSAAEHKVGLTALTVADRIARTGATDLEKARNLKEAKRIASAATRNAVASLVKLDPRLAITPTAFDADPWALNTPTGVVDLATGTILPHDASRLMSKMTAAGPDIGGACPEWRRFLAEATGGDADLEAYLQRVAGYCLTGQTREQVLLFIWGPGGNGKSIFLNTLTQVLGDYARQAPMDTFTASTTDRHPTELASLQGARLVAASETQAGRRWDEARVKGLTGGDPVAARFMRGDYFTYVPQFKLVFVGNHKPEIRDLDAAMQRRIHLVPFTVTPARVDPDLAEKLRAEYPAILGWAVEGCLQWQRQGLAAPDAVRATTAEYFLEQDAFGRWLEDCTEPAEGGVSTADLFQSWREWAGQHGEYVGSMKRMSQALITKKFARWRHPESRVNGFAGLTLKSQEVAFGHHG